MSYHDKLPPSAKSPRPRTWSLVVTGIVMLIVGISSLYQLVHATVHALVDGLWLLGFILIAMDAVVIVGTGLVCRKYRRGNSHPWWIQTFMTGGYFAASALILSFVAISIERAMIPA